MNGTDLTAHRRFSHGGGSYIYRGINIERMVKNQWLFSFEGKRVRAYSLREAKLYIDHKIEQLEKAGA